MNEFLDHLDMETAGRHQAKIPAGFLDQALQYADRHHLPLLTTFLKPDKTFWVTGSELQLCLGDPNYDPKIPTNREFIREHGDIAPSRMSKGRLYEEYGITPEQLDDPMCDEQFAEYACRFDCPSANAYGFLEDLPVHDFRDESGESVGSLYFQDGVCPGNDSKIVTAENYLSLSCLQWTLEQKGYRCNFNLETD